MQCLPRVGQDAVVGPEARRVPRGDQVDLHSARVYSGDAPVGSVRCRRDSQRSVSRSEVGSGRGGQHAAAVVPPGERRASACVAGRADPRGAELGERSAQAARVRGAEARERRRAARWRPQGREGRRRAPAGPPPGCTRTKRWSGAGRERGRVLAHHGPGWRPRRRATTRAPGRRRASRPRRARAPIAAAAARLHAPARPARSSAAASASASASRDAVAAPRRRTRRRRRRPATDSPAGPRARRRARGARPPLRARRPRSASLGRAPRRERRCP